MSVNFTCLYAKKYVLQIKVFSLILLQETDRTFQQH